MLRFELRGHGRNGGGFGLHDRIWFPYAHTARPVEHLPELHALCEGFDRAQLHHRYVFEPQTIGATG